MTIEEAVNKAIEDHYKLTGRAIGKQELKNDAKQLSGVWIVTPVELNQSIKTLKRAKRIRETKPNYYAPYGVKVNDGLFPTAKDIVPTPRRKKDGSGRNA